LNLRGFRRDRFWGKTTFYNSNELQYLFDVKTRLFNGKFGLLGLYDQGRVWQPGESSDLWHSGVGGGILMAPFNKLAVSVSYAKSKEYGLIHLRFNMPID
jgi:hemolysin activation/secretion protein